ncbi:unnamed protein product [Sphagnum jensenii]
MDPSPSRLPTTAPVEIAVSSPDTQLPAISLIFIYVQQRFPHPRTPMPRHLHTLRCPKYKLKLGAPEGSIPDSGHTPASHNETRPKNKGVGNHADHAAPHTGPPLTWIRSWHRDYKHCSYQINTKCDLNIDIPHVYSTVLMTDFLRLKY